MRKGGTETDTAGDEGKEGGFGPGEQGRIMGFEDEGGSDDPTGASADGGLDRDFTEEDIDDVAHGLCGAAGPVHTRDRSTVGVHGAAAETL